VTTHKRLTQRIRNSPLRQARRQRARKARDERWDTRYGKGGWIPAGMTVVRNDGPAEPVKRL
jgi:hypothetical protein